MEKLLQKDQDLLQSLRSHYLTLKEEESLADKVLKDIVVHRGKNGLEVRYIFADPQA